MVSIGSSIPAVSNVNSTDQVNKNQDSSDKNKANAAERKFPETRTDSVSISEEAREKAARMKDSDDK